MNLPTKLTFLRIFLIPVFVVLFFVDFKYNAFAAVFVFAFACFTDFLDGYLARKNNQVTTLGKFLDPIADKMLVACALIAVVVVPVTPLYEASWYIQTPPVSSPSNPEIFQIFCAVFAMIILCRELLVSCFRIVASSKNVILAADIWGKLKTIFQMVALLVLIPYSSIALLNVEVGLIFYYIGFGLLALATLFTILSGANYIIKNKGVLKD